MVVLAFAAVVYGSLVASFFSCCGIDGWDYANPNKSPLGGVVTVVVVWPAVGLVCLVLGEGLGELFQAIPRARKGLLNAIRRAFGRP